MSAVTRDLLYNEIDHIIDNRGQTHYGFTIVFRDGAKVRRIVPEQRLLVSDEAKKAMSGGTGS